MSNAERMGEVWKRRKTLHPQGYYSIFNPDQLYIIQRREEEFLAMLRRLGLHTLRGRRILDLGCGGGAWVRRLLQYGALPGDIVGVELQSDLARSARRIHPDLSILQGDASLLPFADDTFDVVHLATVMTLLLDPGLRERVAREMMRVLRPGGAILWFDFRYTNPRNPDARGIGRREIHRLFPGARIDLRSFVLAPPLSRRLVRWSVTACRLLELVPPLRSHYMASIVINDPPGT